ncbi:hypothetical protein HID58_072273, partial [Brassica napus]
KTMKKRTIYSWGAAIVIFVVLMIVTPTIPQSQAYHDFADQRTFFGIPNALNVISNFPFLIIGLIGLVLCFYPDDYFRFSLRGEKLGWTCFFVGVAAVAFGSSYYHLHPDDARLVWDRLPMTIAFTSIMAIFVIERIDEHKGTYSIVPLLLVGLGVICRFFDDLRPYALVQFVPCIVIPLMAILLPPMYTHSTYWLWAAGFYLLAKVEEAADKPIYSWTHHIISGHSIKHVCAAMVPVFLTLMLAKRSVQTERISLYKTWKISWTRSRGKGTEEESFECTYTNVAVEEARLDQPGDMGPSFPFIDQVLLISQTLMSFPHLLVISACLLVAVFAYHSFRPRCIYLIDFSCYQPPDFLRSPIANFIEHLNLSGIFDRECLDLQQKILERSGIGDDACVPVTVHEIPPHSSLSAAREETHDILFTVVQDLFSKHKIDPKSIDILVSNCSLFCPSPSITSIIINKFGMRSNVKSFSLSGMGCSAGLLSINLVKDLMKIHSGSLALVLSMEAVSPNGYKGKCKSMLIANTIFRMGGAAILLSNRERDKDKAKYKLQHLIRTHLGSDDESYESVMQEVDEEGLVGVALSKQLVKVASKALKINVVELGPRVLPYSEQLKYIISFIKRKWRNHKEKEVYTPNFKKAFEHFCIHAGGRAIIEGVEKHLKLEKEDGEASRTTLYRYGNTSSSSLWYEMQYLEAKGRMKKGDRVWQIGLGSGFKANSAVWKCVSEIDSRDKNAWSDRIHLYPVCGDASG